MQIIYIVHVKYSENKQKDQLWEDVHELDRKLMKNNDRFRPLLNAKSESDDDNKDLAPIEILISENLFVSFDRDGSLKKFEIKGDVEIGINDPSFSLCVIKTNINPSKKLLKFGKPIWRLHPKMNSNEWKKGILCLKDTTTNNNKFKVGKSNKTNILKFKMKCNNNDEDNNNLPINIEFWPELETDGTVTVNVQYNCNMALKNAMITFPTPTKYEPKVLNCDNGNTAFYKNEQEFQWILNDDTEGSLEYVVDDVELDDLYPISVDFQVINTFSEIEISDVYDAQNQTKYKYSVKETCVAKKYVVEA